MSDLAIALIGGAIGSVATAGLAQLGRARAACRQIALNDIEAAERNAQLVVWVDDRTRQLMIEMSAITDECAARGIPESGIHGGNLKMAKEQALHEYRDEEWRARLDLFHVRAREGGWHTAWRWMRRRPTPALTARAEIAPFLERWREPVTRHAPGEHAGAKVRDRTTRTTAEALAELPGLPLT